jgi:hypothetical protein
MLAVFSSTTTWAQVVAPEYSAVKDFDPLEFLSGDSRTIFPGDETPCENVIPQLKNFPTPRYRTGNQLNKNYPWLPVDATHNGIDITIAQQGNNNTPDENHEASKASVFLELARNWNYYYTLAQNTKDGYTLSTKILTDSANLPINYPLKTCATTYWAQSGTEPTNAPIVPYAAYPPKPDTRGRIVLPPRQIIETNPSSPEVFNVCGWSSNQLYNSPHIQNYHLATEYYLHRNDTVVEGIEQLGFFIDLGSFQWYDLAADEDRYCTTPKIKSPIAPNQTYELDGIVNNYQLNILNDVLHRPTPIDMVNENGEVEYHVLCDITAPNRNRAASILRSANIVADDYATNYNGLLTNKRQMHQYFGEGAANRYDAYTSLNKQTYKSTLFTIYQQEGNLSSGSRLDWNAMRKTTPDFVKYGTAYKYPTPQYYPFQQTWKWGCCAFDGLDFLEESRENEIFRTDINNNPLPPDPYYSPYVAAGWDADEMYNIRPAQWLGLMKNQVIMGAEFFYTGFFGNDNNAGKSHGNVYPTSYGINLSDMNAANYIWQTTTPSYAQALTSYVEKFYFHSELLWRMVPDIDDPLNNPPLRNADLSIIIPPHTIPIVPQINDHPLVSARKHINAEQYLITASLQPAEDHSLIGTPSLLIPRNHPSTEYAINIAVPKYNGVNAPFTPIRVNARRQGSTYFLDDTDTKNKIFYQLDGWHQWEHPHHWDKNAITIEAELYDQDPQSNTLIKTDCHSCGTNAYDFTDFTTYTTAGTAEYTFDVRAGDCVWDLFITRRSADASDSQGINATLIYPNGTTIKKGEMAIPHIDPTAQVPPNPHPHTWQEERLMVDMKLQAGTYTLRITQRSEGFDIDRLSLRKITTQCGCQN